MSNDLPTEPAAAFLRWPTEIRNLGKKQAVAERVATFASDGDIVGIGAGSTAYLAVRAIAARAQASGLRIQVVASSYEIEIAARTLGLQPISLMGTRPTWMLDGLDEIDAEMRVLKGRGGALFREKLLWAACPRRYVVIDESKKVDRLGSKFPVPIEVHPTATHILFDYLSSHSQVSEFEMRTASGKDGPVISEAGYCIVDARLTSIPTTFHHEVKMLPGVLETGIFENYEFTVIEEG